MGKMGEHLSDPSGKMGNDSRSVIYRHLGCNYYQILKKDKLKAHSKCIIERESGEVLSQRSNSE